MAKGTKYVAKIPDRNGYIHYTDEEHQIWHELITRQRKVLPGRACAEYIDALELLGLPDDRVPQCEDVSRVLREHTGWEVAPVPALINFTDFFNLLANKRFPAASFIRTREEMEYLQEPDIFHEIFGHTPCSLIRALPPSLMPTARRVRRRARKTGRCWRGCTGSQSSSA
jgi:phenylalanine-4-hydroxylase